MRKAANDEMRPLWPATAQISVMQAREILKNVETRLCKQDHTLRDIVPMLEVSIQRIRRAIRVVSKGLR
jgi:hypothetical protein